jgi:hypothetical protein
MSGSEFMNTKCFGEGVYRPYADYISDVSTQVDNLLVSDPAFARFIENLVNRDFLFVVGKRVALLCLSSSAYRHYPFRDCPQWADLFQITEEQFLSLYEGADETATLIQQANLDSYLADTFNFTTPISIAFPAIFFAGIESPDWNIRQSAVNKIAELIITKDRAQYEEYIEMQKPKSIFLSHKSADKALVREIASTLHSIGLAPWLDEDRMKAGASLERAILQGFHDSCAAVFFVTPNFIDDGYLASEIDYAIAQKRSKGDKFTIITLLLSGEDGSFGKVPELLNTYVWKRVQPIQILRTITEALPIQCGAPSWRL